MLSKEKNDFIENLKFGNVDGCGLIQKYAMPISNFDHNAEVLDYRLINKVFSQFVNKSNAERHQKVYFKTILHRVLQNESL